MKLRILFGLLCLSLGSCAPRVTTTRFSLQQHPTIRPAAVTVWPEGDYGTILVSPEHSGLPGQPTILKAATARKCRIIATQPHAIFSVDSRPVHDVVIDGFEVTQGYDGIRFVGGERITIRNCWVHHNSNQGIALHTNIDSIVEDCLLEVNGNLADRPKLRHGLYASGSRIVVQRNIARSNSGYGIHLWPDANTCRVSNNTCYDHPLGAGIVVAHEAAKDSPDAGLGCLIDRNTVYRCWQGVQIAVGMGDRVSENTLTDNTYAWNLWGPAVLTVYLDRNKTGPEGPNINIRSDPAKKGIVTEPEPTSCNSPQADFNGDHSVDGIDYGMFAGCFNGTGNPINPGCECADLNGDNSVDGIDFGLFAGCFNGTGNPSPCQ